MASDSQKLDYLWKKLGYGATKTAPPPPAVGGKEAFNESIPSPLLYRGDLVWTDSGSIPATQPSTTTSIVQVYKDTPGAWTQTVECTEDLTAPDNQTWKTNLQNWIPTQFGSTYLVKVYVDATGSTTPQTTGTQLFQAGSGNDDGWFFDYQSGVLNFNGANIPSVINTGVTGKSVYIVGARYIGQYGVGAAVVLGNLSISNTTITTNLADGNITLTPTGNSLVSINTTTGLVLPVGNTSQQPSPATTGTLRFNTTETAVEVYTGSTWELVGKQGTITNQIITPDGISTDYTLNQSTTAAAILVSLNGVVQIPGPFYAYTVSGNIITFSEAPLSSDLIDIRFL